MSILIKGLDMPKNCNECMSECINIPLECYPDGDTVPDCPLIEIPTPHGRLIDEDTLNFHYEKEDGVIVYDAPTILEAEE